MTLPQIAPRGAQDILAFVAIAAVDSGL